MSLMSIFLDFEKAYLSLPTFIHKAYNAEIIQGVGSDLFAPNDNSYKIK